MKPVFPSWHRFFKRPGFPPRADINTFVVFVARHGVSPAHIYGDSRRHEFVRPRQEVMWLANQGQSLNNGNRPQNGSGSPRLFTASNHTKNGGQRMDIRLDSPCRTGNCSGRIWQNREGETELMWGGSAAPNSLSRQEAAVMQENRSRGIQGTFCAG